MPLIERATWTEMSWYARQRWLVETTERKNALAEEIRALRAERARLQAEVKTLQRRKARGSLPRCPGCGHFVSGSKEMCGAATCNAVVATRDVGWTDDDIRLARNAYRRGERDAHTVYGNRLYYHRRHLKRRAAK